MERRNAVDPVTSSGCCAADQMRRGSSSRLDGGRPAPRATLAAGRHRSLGSRPCAMTASEAGLSSEGAGGDLGGVEVVEDEGAHQPAASPCPIPRPWCSGPSQDPVSPVRVTRYFVVVDALDTDQLAVVPDREVEHPGVRAEVGPGAPVVLPRSFRANSSGASVGPRDRRTASARASWTPRGREVGERSRRSSSVMPRSSIGPALTRSPRTGRTSAIVVIRAFSRRRRRAPNRVSRGTGRTGCPAGSSTTRRSSRNWCSARRPPATRARSTASCECRLGRGRDPDLEVQHLLLGGGLLGPRPARRTPAPPGRTVRCRPPDRA